MKTRHYILIYIISVSILAITAGLLPAPGYMDADYYYAGGLNLAEGRGFEEPFLWNFLDAPAGIPHPAFTYWMPLPSLLAAMGMAMAGSSGFLFARLVFILLAGGIAPLSAWLAYSYNAKIAHAWTAGLLAAAGGFYLPYLVTTSTFTPAMVLGPLYILCGAAIIRGGSKRYLIMAGLFGALAGLLHLNRADGLVWAGLGIVLIAAAGYRRKVWPLVGPLLAFTGGYLLVCGGWYVRNLAEFGAMLPPGSGAALYFTSYDDLYLLDSSVITPERWLASGLSEIIRVRVSALSQNLLRALAVQCQVFLAPLIVLGAAALWKDLRIKISTGIWIATLGIMTLVFPFAGMRGGFFHSSAMVQPVFWSLVPAGLERAIDYGVRKRNWQPGRSYRILASGLILLSLLISLWVVQGRAVSGGTGGDTSYKAAGELLESLGIPSEAVIMVNNPPGFYLASRRTAVVIPAGGSIDVLRAAEQYGVEYLLLDSANNSYLEALYLDADGTSEFQPLGGAGSLRLFRIKP